MGIIKKPKIWCFQKQRAKLLALLTRKMSKKFSIIKIRNEGTDTIDTWRKIIPRKLKI